MKNKLLFILAGFAALSVCATALAAMNVQKRYQGGVEVGALSIAGTEITATGTEINYTDVTTAGVAQGSKALVLSSAKTLTGITQLESAVYQIRPFTSVITESRDLSTNELLSYGYYRVATHDGAVDLDFGEDKQFASAFRGARWVFVVEGGGTNALTVTAGTTVATMKLVDTDGVTCEDEGDRIEVMVYSTAHAVATTYCAD